MLQSGKIYGLTQIYSAKRALSFKSLFVICLGLGLVKMYYENKSNGIECSVSPQRHRTSTIQNKPTRELWPELLLHEFYLAPEPLLGFSEKISCTDPKNALIRKNKTHIFIVQENLDLFYNASENVSCCLQSFYVTPLEEIINETETIRPAISYSDCVNFSSSLKLDIEEEFIKIVCHVENRKIYSNRFLLAPEKNNYREIDMKGRNKYNVIVLGVDSDSRLNLRRTMPKTLKLLLRLGAVHFNGYTTPANSCKNAIPLMTGLSHNAYHELCTKSVDALGDTHNAPFNNIEECTLIWQLFKSSGFYTAVGESFDSTMISQAVDDGLNLPSVDYYAFPFMHEIKIDINNSQDKFCIQERPMHEILLNYVEKLSVTLRYKRLFGLFWDKTSNKKDLKYRKLMDESYEKFFNNMNISGYLDRSIIFFVSNHGSNDATVLDTNQGRKAVRLDFLYALIPPLFPVMYRQAFKNLKQNTNLLTSAFNLHATLVDLVDLRNINTRTLRNRTRGKSLFMKTCERHE